MNNTTGLMYPYHYIQTKRVGGYWDIVLTREPRTIIKDVPGKLRAVLINGHPESESLDTSLMWHNLRDRKVPDEDIFILEGKETKVNTYSNTVKFPSTLKCIEDAVGKIKSESTKNDRMFFHVNNHGRLNSKGLSEMNFYGDRINEREFLELVGGIHCNFGLFHFSACYSGGFAEAIGQINNFIGISGTSRTLPSGYVKGLGCGCFTTPFADLAFKSGENIQNAFLHAASKIEELGLEFDQRPQLFYSDANPFTLHLNPEEEGK